MEAKKWKCLTSQNLKLIALITMTLDHIGAVLLPQFLVLRVIGRIAFPIYSFLIVNGFFYTRNWKKYLMRLFMFAGISEVCFDLTFFGKAIYWGYQNVYFTLGLGLLMIALLEKIRTKNENRLSRLYWNMWIEVLVVLLVCGIAWMIQSDYHIFGILMIYGFYQFRTINWNAILYQAIINAILMGGVQGFAVMALPVIGMYNGKPGTTKMKWMFYLYYPLHLMVIYFIKFYST